MHFLEEITLIAIVSVLVTLVLGRFKLPVVAGLILSGALVGPHGFSLAKDAEVIEVIAEVGVVFLLFTIGLEFSLGRLKHIFKQVALGGLIQVGCTAAIATGIALWLNRPLPESIVYGFVFALSSTALVLRTLNERNELDAPHGRFIVGTLIFQDLCIVPMVLIIPLLSQGLENLSVWKEVGLAMGQAGLMVIGLFVCSRKLVPLLFKWVDASRSSEVFILTVLCLCIGTAYLTSLTGLSLALGAFLAGMIVADTDFRHRAMGDILPLKDVFVSFFFVSLGMFFNFEVLVNQTGTVILLLLAFLFGKGPYRIYCRYVYAIPSPCRLVGRCGLGSIWRVWICPATISHKRKCGYQRSDCTSFKCRDIKHVLNSLNRLQGSTFYCRRTGA
jgi:CPA2 family monovalent cation:H+ antiporter-2